MNFSQCSDLVWSTNSKVLYCTDSNSSEVILDFTQRMIDEAEAESVLAALADEDQFCAVCNLRFPYKPSHYTDDHYCQGCGKFYFTALVDGAYRWKA